MRRASRDDWRDGAVARLALVGAAIAMAACDGAAPAAEQSTHLAGATARSVVAQSLDGRELGHRGSTSSDFPAVVDDQDLSVPLTIGELVPPSPATSEFIWLAAEKLTRECMAQRGFDYSPLPSPEFERGWREFRDGQLMTTSRAQASGYQPVPYAMPPDLAEAYIELEELTNSNPAYRAAYSAQAGEAAELGCSVVAHERLWARADLMSADFGRLIGEAEGEVLAAIHANPTYRAAVTAWSTCMSAGGYDYLTPDDAFADERWFTASGTPTEAERAAALHDASCREAVGLNVAARQAQQQAVAAWIEQNHATVQALRAAETEMLSTAQRLLDG